MFSHVPIKLGDLARNRAFYAQVLERLGYGIVLAFEGIVVGCGTDPDALAQIHQADTGASLSTSVHIPLDTDNEDEPRALCAAAVANGLHDNPASSEEPEYEPGYFTAFVNNWNGHSLQALPRSSTY